VRFDKDKYRVSGSAVSFMVMFILVVSNPALNAAGKHGELTTCSIGRQNQ